MRADPVSDDTIIPHSFYATEPGPHLLILGAVHGNEKCGSDAILNRVLPRLQSKEIAIRKGKVTFIPICNPRAYVQDVRYIEANLNRFMGPKPNPQHYEDGLMNQLVPHLQSCDVLLDIHSYTAGGPPFVLRGMNYHRAQEEALAAAMGIDNILYGFADAYKNSGIEYAPRAATGTMEYARERGAYGVTLECGQHKDPVSTDVAERAIYGALLHLDLIVATDVPNGLLVPTVPPQHRRHVHLNQVVRKEREGTIIGNWQHLAPVKAGTLMARYDDGTEIIADRDGVMVMPHPATPVSTEWWYIGVEE